MEQRTLDIIRICKGDTKYCTKDSIYDGIRNYIVDECMINPSHCTDTDIDIVLWKAMTDYLDHCDKPSVFMWYLKTIMDIHSLEIHCSIAVVFGSYTQVKDKHGNYVNGFDDRLFRLDKEKPK